MTAYASQAPPIGAAKKRLIIVYAARGKLTGAANKRLIIAHAQ